MITNHIIKQDRIILYFDYSFEIGSFEAKERKSIISQIYDYLKKTKINFNGKKIMLMLGSTLVATLIYTGGTLKLDNIESSVSNQVEISEKKEVIPSENIIEEVIVQEKVEDSVRENKEDKPIKQTNVSQKQEPKDLVPIKKEETKAETKNEEINNNMVTIYRSNGTVLEIEMEEYIVGVVAAEMPASFNIEALKAQSVIARTYALKKQSRGEILTDTVSTQAFIDISQMKDKWGTDYSKYYNKIVSAVKSTKGEYLTYDGEYIEALYHSTSNGYTEDAVNVWGTNYPYLKSVESSWDKKVSSYLKVTTKETNTILDILGIDLSDNIEVSILSRNTSGRVKEVQIGEKIYSGIQFRNLLGIRSTDFDIEIDNDYITIITRGYGHGVGMSQYGANEMAKSGYNYKDIINHYYTDVKLNK